MGEAATSRKLLSVHSDRNQALQAFVFSRVLSVLLLGLFAPAEDHALVYPLVGEADGSRFLSLANLPAF